MESKTSCPFCNNPKKSPWHFDGEKYVVADDAGRENTLILFSHQHKPQNWLKERKEEVEELIVGIANAEWGRDVEKKFDWVARTYPGHGHLQLIRRG